MSAKTTNAPRKDNSIRIDTDSAPIGIDNRCSLCISNVAEDFVGDLTDTNRKIKGFGGILSQKIKVGTILWRWDDDQGREHKFTIPNSLYVPSGKCRLLSPQHWAQTRQDNQKPAFKTTNKSKVVLTWGKQKYQLTTPLGKRDNVATLSMSPGYNKFNLFCKAATMDFKDEENPIQQSSNLVTDDEEDPPDFNPTPNRTWATAFQDTPECIPVPQQEDQDLSVQDTLQSHSKTEYIQEEPRPVTFDTEPDQMRLPTQQKQEEDITSGSDAALLLRYHYKYGHISFKRLKKMAEQGIIPSRLKDTYTPSCLACQYAKATKRPWRNKKQKGYKKPIQATHPGQA